MLASSHAVLLAVFDATPECIKIVAPDGSVLQMNPAGVAMLEAPEGAQLEGACVFDVIAPEFREDWKAHHRRVCEGERLSWEFDIIGLGGTRRHMETHAVPLLLPDDTHAQLAITRDVTRRKEAERQQKLLIDELNHRVKNTLATVQSLMVQTAHDAGDVGTYHRALEARIVALSHAHDQLSRRNWTDADLKELVHAGLAPYRGAIEIDGDSTLVSPRSALLLSLAFHELACNATKFGALSEPSGKVHLEWEVQKGGADPHLHLRWRESGGPGVFSPGI